MLRQTSSPIESWRLPVQKPLVFCATRIKGVYLNYAYSIRFSSRGFGVRRFALEFSTRGESTAVAPQVGDEALAEDLVARLEPRHVLADRLDRARDIHAPNTSLGRAEPEAHDAQQAGLARHHVPVTDVEASRLDAYEHVVDCLLASPRYGERWARHWLDAIHYADTHGHDQDRPRMNAWPYRDYVIRAFNDDTPYDRFIREQIVGDAMGQDAATGFLVTASVLLPGQIGKDEPSKRLARQDSLDEIVMNIGQAFLGLSIGCARCHDHKFDPISQREYYQLFAFLNNQDEPNLEVAAPEELTKRDAYRAKAKKHHPDIGGDETLRRRHRGESSAPSVNAAELLGREHQAMQGRREPP